MTTAATPSLETIAGLYKAACDQKLGADLALTRVLESAAKHGYTEAQLAAAAGPTFVLPAPIVTFQHFEHVLRAHSLIDPAAMDDPDGYDNYRTHDAVHAAHRELFG